MMGCASFRGGGGGPFSVNNAATPLLDRLGCDVLSSLKSASKAYFPANLSGAALVGL